MKRKSILTSISIAIIITSCLESYYPPISKYDQLLVIDGKITNEQGPYTIKISRSSALDQNEFDPLNGCSVVIESNEGMRESLIEIDDGIYQTDANGIQGVAGIHYRLHVTTPKGLEYVSAFEELQTPVEIDSVYAQIEYREDQNVNHSLAGYQFYLNTDIAENDTNYYSWDLTATYHYQSDYTIRWIYEGSLEWFHGPDSLFNCWNTYKVSGIYVAKTEDLQKPEIRDFPLHYVNTQTRQLSVKYSILVKQYTISEEAYIFYDGIYENNQGGGLYDNQPVQIRGNMYNIENDQEPVLGYFLVAGVDQERIFVDRPKSPVPFYYSECSLTEADFERYTQLWWMPASEYPIYAIESPGGRRAVPHKDCVDCRQHGGAIEKPDFWID